MRHAVIVHGMPSEEEYYAETEDSPSNAHWLPWLQRQLCLRNILTQTPEMPHPFKPDYEEWQQEFERCAPVSAAVLIGHSCGAGFLLRWLAESGVKIPGKVVLVAPWIDVEKEFRPFFDFVLPHTVGSLADGGIEVLASTDDSHVILSSVDYIRKRVEDITYHEFVGLGHFTYESMKRREFPELLNICLA